MCKKLTFIILPLFFIVFTTGFNLAYSGYYDDEKSAKTLKTFTGILIDTKCYGMNEDNFTNDHMSMKSCGKMCAKMGIPVGLLVDGKKGGKVYVLTIPAPALADYMGEWVRVSGEKVFKGGLIPEKIEIKKGDIYEQIDVETMM